MKRLVPMFDNSGTKYSIPEDRVDEFRADMGNVAEAKRYRGKDGQHYTIPQDQDEAFRADMPDAVPVRSYTMADGSRRDFTMSEMSKFLRSKEYRESEDYTPPQMGSPTWVAVKGALGGAAEGAYYGGKNALAKVATALPEAAASVGEAVGNVINLGGNARNAVGDWLRASGQQTKRWLGENIRGDQYDENGNLVMSGLTKDLGYEDALTKIGETAGDAAAMAVKFAPAAVAGPAYMETILASDGINAYADTFDRAKAAGYSVADANLAGAASGLINYFGAKLMMKGGAATKDIANPLLRALGGMAFTGAATGAQKAGSEVVNRKVGGEGTSFKDIVSDFATGFAEGAQFHLINEVGTNAKQSMAIRRETREMKEMRKENLLTAAETPEGRAFLNTVVQNEGVDAAVKARKEGKDVSRKMGAAADLPDNMSQAERNEVIDGIMKAREAQAERVRTKMDDVQAQALADEIGSLLDRGIEDPMFEDVWLGVTKRVKDATELDDPQKRAELVDKAITDVVGLQLDAGPANREAKSYEEKFAENRRLRTPTRVGEKEIAEDQEARAMGKRIEAEGEAQRKAAEEKAQAEYDEKMAAYEEARAKREAEKKRYGRAKTELPEKPTPPELRVEKPQRPVIEADLSKNPAQVDSKTPEKPVSQSTKSENRGEIDKVDKPQGKIGDLLGNAESDAALDAEMKAREKRDAEISARLVDERKASGEQELEKGDLLTVKDKNGKDIVGKVIGVDKTTYTVSFSPEYDSNGLTASVSDWGVVKKSDAKYLQKSKQSSQPPANTPSRAPQEKGTTSQADAAEGVEARNGVSAKQVKPIVAKTSAAKKALGKGKSGYSIEGTKESFDDSVDSVRGEIESLKDDGKSIDFITKDGKYHISVEKGQVLDHETDKYVPAWHVKYTDNREGFSGGGVAEKSIDDAISYVKKLGAKVFDAKVPDGKGKMVKKPAATAEKSSAVAPAAQSAVTADALRERAKTDPALLRLDEAQKKAKTDAERNALIAKAQERIEELRKEMEAETKEGRPALQIDTATPAQKLADPDFKAWARKQGRTPTDGARRIYDAQRVDSVLAVAKNWLKGVTMRRTENAAEVPNGARMSIGDKMDDTYMDAVRRGDMATAARMVREAAGIGDIADAKTGTPIMLAGFHGTPKGGHTVFNGKQNGSSSYGVEGATFVSTSRDVADTYSNAYQSNTSLDPKIRENFPSANEWLKNHGAKVFARRFDKSKKDWVVVPAESVKAGSKGWEYDVRTENGTFISNSVGATPEDAVNRAIRQVAYTMGKNGDSMTYSLFVMMNNPLVVDFNSKNWRGEEYGNDIPSITRKAKSDGYDGVVFKNVKDSANYLSDDAVADTIAVFNPSQIKSADPVTCDAGNVIPLSQRFNPRNSDIRYLYSKDGNVVGWYDRAKKEVVTLPGADADTVAHELGWHATYDYARERAEAARAIQLPTDKGDFVERKTASGIERIAHNRAGRAYMKALEAKEAEEALLKKLNEYANNAPQAVKNEILRKYGMATDAATLLDEIGAARYTMDNVNKIKDAADRRQTAKWYQRTWNAIADTYKAMLSKMGWNKARLDNLSALTPEQTVNLLADEMLRGKTLGKAKSSQIDMNKGETVAQLHDRKFKDRLRPIEELEKDAGKSVERSAHTLFRNLPGKVQGAIGKAQNFAEKVKADCKKAGIKIDELNEFLYASAASERNAKVLARNGRLGGSAMSHADIHRILTAYRNSPKYAAMRRIADMALAFQKKGFDFRRKAGLISYDTWHTLSTEEPNHVPMKSRFDPNGEHMGFSLTEQFGKPEWKTAEGRTNVGDGPLEWIAQEYVDAFSRGHENFARRALLETVLAHPEVGEVKKLGPNDALGEVKRKGQQGDPNVFIVKTDGDTYQVRLNGTRGELIARAVSGRGLIRAPQSLQKAMRWWSATATSWSPTFAARNFLADTVDVFAVNIGEKGLIKGTAAFGKHVYTALKLTNEIRKYAATGETTNPLIREAVDAGVLMGGGVRSQAFADAGEAALKTLKTDWSNGKNRVKAVRNAMFGWVDTLNQTAELMNRMADYKMQREAGKSKNEAALHAREITVDFNEKGEFTPATNLLYMFSNSTLGATMRLNKAIFASKEGMSLAAGTFAIGLIEGIAEALSNGDDDDGKNMNEYTRANSFYFRNGKDIYRIPLHASPISVIKYAGNCTARKLFGTLRGDKAAEQVAKDMIGMMTSYLGIGALGDNEAASIAPTIVQPFIQAYMNRDFADRPIERTSFSEVKPKSGNGRTSTPQFYKDLATWLNEFGGGNEGRKGELNVLGEKIGTDFSPEMLKHFAEATGKNALRDIENTVEFAKMVLGKTEWDRRNIPFVRDYFRTTGGNDNRYFEAMRVYDADAEDFKTQSDKAGFLKSHPWLRKGADSKTTVNRLTNMVNRENPRTGVSTMGITQLRKLTEGKVRREDGTYFEPKVPISEEMKAKAKEWLQKRQARVIEIMGK